MSEFVLKTYAIPQAGDIHSILNYEDKSGLRDIITETWHKVLATEDKQIQDALIKLGWTPPAPKELTEEQHNDDFCYWSHCTELKAHAEKLNVVLKEFLSSIDVGGSQAEEVEEALMKGICRYCLRWDLKDGESCYCMRDD